MKMKQHITIEQLNELSEKALRKLQSWKVCHEGDIFENVLGERYVVNQETHAYMIGEKFENIYPLLSIGQMIEFLEEQDYDLIRVLGKKYHECEEVYEAYTYLKDGSMWCDALWEAVKEVLEK